MIKQYVFRSLTALFLTICVGSLHAAPQETSLDIKQFESGLSGPNKIAGEPGWTLAQRMEHYGVPGVSVAVIKNNKIIWSKAYGVMDRESNQVVSTDTLFQCASISKPVSSAAALRMAEQGVFSLDADINQYLTSWKLPENEFTAEQHVTLKHLVGHKGGITVHGFRGYSTSEQVPTMVQILNGQSPANSPAIRVDKVPGESFRYSGGGYCVMQQMMQEQLGKSFPHIMREMVLDQIKMSKSTFQQPLPAHRLNEAATGYYPNGDIVSGKRHTYPEMAPAGLWTTAEDLAQFLIELQLAYKGESTKILSQAMARRMIDENLGIFTRQRGDDTYFGHGGWNEGFSSEAIAHRDNGYGIVVLTNSNHPRLVEEIINSAARVYNWSNVGAQHIALDLSAEDIANVVGRYNMDSELVKIYSDNGKLLYHQIGNPPQQLIRVGEKRYVRREQPHVITVIDNAESGRKELILQTPEENTPGKGTTAYLMSDKEMLPIELLESQEFEKAKSAYLAAQKTNPAQSSLDESNLNNLGYQLLETKEFQFAIDVFRINTLLYPESFNAWDSLGEGYLLNDNLELAKANYQKSLVLNPSNAGASRALKAIELKQQNR